MHEKIYSIVLKRGEEVTVEESFDTKSRAKAQLRKQAERGVGSWRRINPTLYVREDRDGELQVQENNLHQKDPRREVRW